MFLLRKNSRRKMKAETSSAVLAFAKQKLVRKLFAILFVIGFLAVLVSPLITLAQTSKSVADCCVIRRGFTFEDLNLATNDCVTDVGGDTSGACDAVNSGAGCEGTVQESAKWGMVCVLNTIFRVADLVFAILLAVSILLILLAAWTFITAGGAPDKINKARDYIFYALIGLVVAFLARAIPSIVNLLL